jgi:CRP-like cAMP-binding protein
MQTVPQPLAEGSLEWQAIEAGEIDAVIDYANSNVILLPAARRALLAKALADNGLLAALPGAELRLLHGLERVALKFGEVLQEIGEPIHDVYFPVGCVVSLRTQTEGRHALEVGLVGREGMVGLSLALGVEISSVRAMVQIDGTALHMKAERFQEAFHQCPRLQQALHRYADAKLALARRTAVCNCFHTFGGRLARCLLTTSDRARSEEFFLTQAFLADTLGVRRATVNEAAGSLQRRKLITYVRGRIRIVDRKGLQEASCRCYTAVT